MQEEELSVSEILSSIRQVLSKEAEALGDAPTRQTKASTLQKESINSAVLDKPSVLELTPTMRVKNESLLSATTALKTQAALEKLNQIKSLNTNIELENEVKPLIVKWLDTHLPDIVERVVSQEVKRLISAK